MQRTDIEIKLQEIHHQTMYGDEPLVLDQSFRSQGYDSLDQVEFIMNTETAFSISVDEDIWMKINTPNELIDIVLEETTEQV